MQTLLISYDLFKPGQNYPTLIDKIKTLGAWCRPLLSTWLVRTALNPEQARNQLLPHIDPNDKLLVIDVTGKAAAWTVTIDPVVQDWMRKNLPLVA